MNIPRKKRHVTTGESEIDDDADRLDIPINAFDVVIADECHRDYTAQGAVQFRRHT